MGGTNQTVLKAGYSFCCNVSVKWDICSHEMDLPYYCPVVVFVSLTQTHPGFSGGPGDYHVSSKKRANFF